ncbi:MAG: hypothetical protein JWR09_1540 [Mucilaginibacter sp.]|nr:hypothetical protein [Mucilaginibacter sp.]
MKNSEKQLGAFYAANAKEELQKEASKDEVSLCPETPRAKGPVDQKSVASRIAILKELVVKHQG